MTTALKRQSNRKNARLSTGPKTAEGRRKSSQNARRHGLSAAPPATQILHHLRLILGDPMATPETAAQTPRGAAALQLATAEGRLTHAQGHAAEIAARETPHTLSYEIDLVRGELEDLDYLFNIEGQISGRKLLRQLTATSARFDERDRRAARRHLQDAHAGRRKALKKFLELDQFHKTKPN